MMKGLDIDDKVSDHSGDDDKLSVHPEDDADIFTNLEVGDHGHSVHQNHDNAIPDNPKCSETSTFNNTKTIEHKSSDYPGVNPVSTKRRKT